MQHEICASGFPNKLKGRGERLPVSDIGLEPTDVVMNRRPAPRLGPAGKPDNIETLLETIKETPSNKSGRTGHDKAG